MSDQCNQCGESVKYSKSRFCNSCGAEIRPLEVVFTPSLDDNAFGFNQFFEKIKISFYDIVYDFNLWLAKKSINLFDKRMYLSKNLSILQLVPISERSEKLEDIVLDMKEIANKIRSETESIQSSYHSAKDEFDQGELLEAKIHLGFLHKTSKKFGFYQWLSDIILIETQITDNLKCLHQLQKTQLSEKIPIEKVKSSLIYSYFKLLQVENFVNGRNNNPKTTLKIMPQVIAQMDGQKEIFTSKFQELNLKI
ncbi:MAG: hypothetical protein E4G98_01390, partial [Promethearchaeota archaeon]